jgi:MYXO-CTERM domain-containing protein
MMQRGKWLGLVLLYVVLQACTGGSACGGCVEPIPGGFPLDQRVANSAQLRLTPNAITFIEANFSEVVATLMPDGLSFDIPESTTNITAVGDVTICPGGGCTATINVTGVDIQPTPPSSLVIIAQLEVVTGTIRLSTEANFTCLWLSGFECDMSIDTRRASPAYNTMQMTLTFTIDTRTGYTDLEVTGAGLADAIQSEDINIEAANTCGGIWCNVANIGFVKDMIVGQLESTLTDTLTSSLSSFTCMACPTDGCPSGTTCNADGYCAYSDGTCVGMLLGLEGQTDLGSMLASVSPGMSAPVMFVDAAGGYVNVNGNGLNLGAYGGMEATTRNACVPATYTAPWLTYEPAPIATEFSSGSDFTGCRRCPTGTECGTGFSCAASGRCEDTAGVCEQGTQPIMLKVGVAERYLNRVGAGIFDAGTLCLSVGTSAVPQLNSGMLSLLMPAIDKLTWGEPSPVAIEVRPQLPPQFELGDDPLLNVKLQQAQLDFYLWIHERYTKILTVQMDLNIGIQLEASAGQLVPVISSLVAENVDVTDAQIIGPPNNINELFTDLLELVATMIPPIAPIALPEFSGFVLQIPDGGIKKVTEAGDDFLAIYGNLAMAPAAPKPPVETFARLTSVVSPADDLAARAPVRLRDMEAVATIDVASHSTEVTPARTDYRWRVDGGPWSRWTRETRLVVRDARLAFGGDHVVEVQSRLADDDATIDPTPARVIVPVDAVQEYIAGVHRTAPGRSQPSEALRGRPETDPTSSSGCSCAVPSGASSTSSAFGLLGLALGAVVALRRRRVLLAVLALLALVGLGSGGGCDCGNGNTGQDVPGVCTADDQCAPGRCCPTSGQCVELPAQAGYCDPGFDCLDAAGAFAPSYDPATCAFTPDCCAELPPLPVGFVGQHSEVAVAPDGTIWVSAYSAGASDTSTYGDLVVGTWDSTAGEVEWEHVDGVPSGTPTGAPSGWRGGIATPGDDVGKYTTIAIGTDGEPRVAYYDVTNGALKFAVHGASGWTVQSSPVDDTGDAGRWADLAVGTDGRAAIVYNAVEERTDIPGAYLSKVKVARAADAAASSWTVSEIESMDIPCWKALCGEDLVCVAATRTCAAPAADDTACGATGCSSGQACVGTVCEDLFEAPIDFPEGVGIVTGIDFMPDGSPIAVYYDRGAWDRAAGVVVPHGDLKQALWSGGAWAVTVLDGSGGDAGWYPSIDVDAAGQRHVAYVDGISENLIYLNPDAGVREVVDGRSVAGRIRNIIGDDSTIRVTASGRVWVAYQDATARRLMLAERTAPGTWVTRDVDVEDSSGFYANLTLGTDNETPVISTYWHRTTASGTSTTRYAYEAGLRVFEITP